MSQRYSGKSRKDSSTMKKSKLSLLEKRKIKSENKLKTNRNRTTLGTHLGKIEKRESAVFGINFFQTFNMTYCFLQLPSFDFDQGIPIKQIFV